METVKKPDLMLPSLGQFIGTQQYHRVWLGVNATDGVAYIMENGYSWLVTDAISVIKTKPSFRLQDFLVIELKLPGDVKKERAAEMVISDGNDNVLYTQDYIITDAKVGVKMYFTDNVLMLPSEY